MTIKKPAIDLETARRNARIRIIREDEETMRSLLPENAPERRKYPEPEFRRNFLPIVTGEAYEKLPPGYTKERLRDEATRYWLQIAGGPGYEVEVVTATGETAFIVPAIMDTSVLNIAQDMNQASLRHLNREFQEKAVGLPQVAERILARGLNEKLSRLLSQEPDRTEAIKKIEKMHEFYGLKDKLKEAEKKNGQNENFMGEMEF